MGYIKDMYGLRSGDFIRGFLAAIDTYSKWQDGERFIGSPEKEVKAASFGATDDMNISPIPELPPGAIHMMLFMFGSVFTWIKMRME